MQAATSFSLAAALPQVAELKQTIEEISDGVHSARKPSRVRAGCYSRLAWAASALPWRPLATCRHTAADAPHPCRRPACARSRLAATAAWGAAR